MDTPGPSPFLGIFPALIEDFVQPSSHLSSLPAQTEQTTVGWGGGGAHCFSPVLFCSSPRAPPTSSGLDGGEEGKGPETFLLSPAAG